MMKYFGLPISVTWTVYRNVEESSLGIGLKGMYISSVSSERDRPVGLLVRRPPRERKIPGSNPACDGIFLGSSHTSDFKKWHSSGYPARRLAS